LKQRSSYHSRFSVAWGKERQYLRIALPPSASHTNDKQSNYSEDIENANQAAWQVHA
jgi:hypothetical protein